MNDFAYVTYVCKIREEPKEIDLDTKIDLYRTRRHTFVSTVVYFKFSRTTQFASNRSRLGMNYQTNVDIHRSFMPFGSVYNACQGIQRGTRTN